MPRRRDRPRPVKVTPRGRARGPDKGEDQIMRRIVMALIVLGLLAGPALATSPEQMEANKKNVAAFYNAFFNKKDLALAKSYTGAYYKQHNPFAKDGIEGVAGFIAYMKEKMPDFRIQILRIYADGDYVITHVWTHNGPADRGGMAMDIFRMDSNGKVVEHWDVNQPIPEKSMNDNGMK
jgi:predicted SnoaL-like aldol condensation-catalyzing enzyme